MIRHDTSGRQEEQHRHRVPTIWVQPSRSAVGLESVGTIARRAIHRQDRPAELLSARDVIALQRAIGNRATARVMRSSVPLQRLGTSLGTPVPASEPQPFAETPGAQRKYTPAQYVAMWEKEQGRSLTAPERKTIARGCIGVTANNLNGGDNPPLDLSFGTFDQARQEMASRNRTLNWMAKFPVFGPWLAGSARYVVFAKLFWSNQDVDDAKRVHSDPAAFRPDPRTGRVNMTGYGYEGQPGFVNFDYGFWDEASQSFWHANHMDYGDPSDPMIVLQSTPEKFATKVMVGTETRYGYIDFDRVIYGVALANNYDPRLAAGAAGAP